MIFVNEVRKTCLAVILSPGPLKYLFYCLIYLDFYLGVHHYPFLPYDSESPGDGSFRHHLDSSAVFKIKTQVYSQHLTTNCEVTKMRTFNEVCPT